MGMVDEGRWNAPVNGKPEGSRRPSPMPRPKPEPTEPKGNK